MGESQACQSGSQGTFGAIRNSLKWAPRDQRNASEPCHGPQHTFFTPLQGGSFSRYQLCMQPCFQIRGFECGPVRRCQGDGRSVPHK